MTTTPAKAVTTAKHKNAATREATKQDQGNGIQHHKKGNPMQTTVYTEKSLEIPTWITDRLAPEIVAKTIEPILTSLNEGKIRLAMAQVNAERNLLHSLHYTEEVQPGLDPTTPSWAENTSTWSYLYTTGKAYRSHVVYSIERDNFRVYIDADESSSGELDFGATIEIGSDITPTQLRQLATDLMQAADRYQSAIEADGKRKEVNV